MGLKITACTPSWCKFWTKGTKRPKNPTATSKEPGAKLSVRSKRGYCACPLHSTPPVKWKSKLLSRVLLFGIPCTVACQALCPWDSPGKNTGVGSHFLLQGIFLIQGSNLGLPHCKYILYHLNQGSPSTPPEGRANHLSYSSGLNPGHTPTPCKEWAWPPEWVSAQGNSLLVLAPTCCSRGPSKALPEFLVWPLVDFYWLRKTKNPGHFLHHLQYPSSHHHPRKWSPTLKALLKRPYH